MYRFYKQASAEDGGSPVHKDKLDAEKALKNVTQALKRDGSVSKVQAMPACRPELSGQNSSKNLRHRLPTQEVERSLLSHRPVRDPVSRNKRDGS